MRKVLPLLLLLLAFVASAQNSVNSDTPVVLKQLPAEGLLLNNGWKYQAGDNPAYAHPAYDDSHWQPIDPIKDIHDLPQLWKGIGWLRLKIHFDSTLQTQPLALVVEQSGASEIYVNGKLLQRYGIIRTQSNKIVAYDPLGKPFPLQFTQPGENILAIRYSLQPNVYYTAVAGHRNPAFFISLNKMETAMDLYGRDTIITSGSYRMWIGIYLLLLILHLAFYLYYPTQKANLYFAIYALSGLICYLIRNNTFHDVKNIFYQFNISFDVLQLGNFSLLSALYFLLNQKRRWIFWSILILVIAGVILNATLYLKGFMISAFIINTLVNLETVRIAYQGVKNKQRGAWLIATGAICFFVFWCLFLYLVLSGTLDTHIGTDYTIGDLIWDLGFLSIPIATSLFLALDFAFTSRSLQVKLVEVKELAEQNMEQEREKQHILTSQKETLEQQVTERTAALNQSLQELKATQAQLVQREKLASLGELTAGIAHEIQNPLNFVNNFSEINTELLEELKQEAKAGNATGVIQLADELKENEQKIGTHGRRADAIVKGMLQHSRASTGEKEPTDVNAMCDEYLRLSYHGLRAKEKEFTAALETEFDTSIGQVNVVPQDLGRVLLNLFNNAFYATMTKKKLLNGTYEPVVTIRTRRTGDKMEIQVTDNGTGIPKKSLDKIFQPFFTTKPSGEGTGLGLSLSYDIITKGHGGELTVDSQEGQYTTVTVRLPL